MRCGAVCLWCGVAWCGTGCMWNKPELLVVVAVVVVVDLSGVVVLVADVVVVDLPGAVVVVAVEHDTTGFGVV